MSLTSLTIHPPLSENGADEYVQAVMSSPNVMQINDKNIQNIESDKRKRTNSGSENDNLNKKLKSDSKTTPDQTGHRGQSCVKCQQCTNDNDIQWDLKVAFQSLTEQITAQIKSVNDNLTKRIDNLEKKY